MIEYFDFLLRVTTAFCMEFFNNSFLHAYVGFSVVSALVIRLFHARTNFTSAAINFSIYEQALIYPFIYTLDYVDRILGMNNGRYKLWSLSHATK